MDDLLKVVRKYVKSKDLESEIKKKFVVQLIEKRFVESRGYLGEIEMIQLDKTKICCDCGHYFHCEYFGNCDICGEPRCYDCALGGGMGECEYGDKDEDNENNE